MRRASIWVALALLTAGALTASAGAGQPSREAIHEDDSFELEDFCGKTGLTVEVAYVLDLRIKILQRGTTAAPYFMQHGKLTEVITNHANGTFVTTASNVLEKDLGITDNGDGTVTILVLATGNAVLYNADGKAIARNPGQTRFELDIHLRGTPSDPEDDVVLDQRIVRESTGRSDDFCAAALGALS